MNELQAQLPLHALKIHTEWPICTMIFVLGRMILRIGLLQLTHQAG